MRFVAFLFAVFAGSASAEPIQSVDLELVLAVDVSRSMDLEEAVLQRQGYAEALQHPAVLAAITSGELGRIAIAYFEWGGMLHQNLVLDWTIIASAEDAAKAARALDGPIQQTRSGTSISSGLAYATALLENNTIDAPRRVIDVSGDGPNNVGPLVQAARDKVLALGIEINGLPILLGKPPTFFDIPDLDIYYEDCVIGGEGAFIVSVRDKHGFVTAIRRKMVLEIAGLRPPPRLRKVFMSDCLVGEKARKRWLENRGRDYP